MTTHYVSTAGDNADNGLSPDASDATNRPWLTLDYALSNIGDGDTLYIAPGVYREQATVGITPTAETFILGDPKNTQGFKDSGGALLPAGEVRLTNWLTDDITAPTDGVLLDLNGAGHLTIRRLMLVAGRSADLISSGSDAGENVTIEDIALLLSNQDLSHSFISIATSTNDKVINWIINRCRFFGCGEYVFNVNAALGTSEDYDIGLVIKNNEINVTSATIFWVGSAGGDFLPGGGEIVGNNLNYSYIGGTQFWSKKFPVKLFGNLCITPGGFEASELGEVVEDYNLFFPSLNNANVNEGYHSLPYTFGQVAPLVHFGQELIWGQQLRPFGMPTASSPLLGFIGNQLTSYFYSVTGSAANDTGVGTIAWDNPTDAVVSDSAYATAVLLTDEISNYVTITDMGFSLPDSATIVGVAVDVGGKAGLVDTIEWYECKLIKGGVIGGTNQAPAGTWSDTDNTMTLGGASNPWGQTLSKADVEASDFGVALSVQAAGGDTAYIDWVQIQVYFTLNITMPDDDLLARPRPAGGQSILKAVGALERHDTGGQELTTYHTGPSALVLTGPSDQEFIVPVDAASTTITVWARYDTNHGATNKPQMMVVGGEGIGVAEATDTMAAAVDTWEQLSLTFTPTAKGFVRVRFINRAAAGNGVAIFDDFDY